MIFTTIGFCICLGALIVLSIVAVIWLNQGGPDCGPIDKYGAWTFYVCVLIMAWYCLIKYSPVTIAISGG